MGVTRETVVLVHGLWMHGLIFVPQRRWLSGEGFAARTFSYPSLRRGLVDNAQALARFLGGLEAPTIHLVGHSLGGLVALAMQSSFPDPRVCRLVTMGSPINDCHAARMLLKAPGLRRIVGRSIQDWLAQPAPPLPSDIEVGVIAGNRSLGLGRVIPRLPQPNDGVVTVAEACIAGATDTLVLPIAHSEMLVSPPCARQVAAFLRTGRFLHG